MLLKRNAQATRIYKYYVRATAIYNDNNTTQRNAVAAYDTRNVQLAYSSFDLRYLIILITMSKYFFHHTVP